MDEFKLWGRVGKGGQKGKAQEISWRLLSGIHEVMSLLQDANVDGRVVK